jgi:hypothetical protein
VPILLRITLKPWACKLLTVWDAVVGPDGTALAAAANPNAAIAIAPATAGIMMDFIGHPFVLMIVIRCSGRLGWDRHLAITGDTRRGYKRLPTASANLRPCRYRDR